MNLPRLCRELRFIEKRGVRDLGIFDAVAPVLPCDPEQQILIQCTAAVAQILPILPDARGIGAYLIVGDLSDVERGDPILRGDALCEDIAIEIHLFQIRKNRLSVLRNGQRAAHTLDILFGAVGIAENQLGEVDKGKVVDTALPTLPGQRDIAQLQRRLFSGSLKPLKLFRGAAQAQLLDVVVGIADLVHDAQGDQQLRRQVAVHVGVQIRMEFALAADIGLDKRLLHAQTVILGLAHQGFGDGGNRRLELHIPVGENVGDLRAAQAQNVHAAVAPIIVAGYLAPDDKQAVLVRRRLKPEELREISDQVPRVVVRCAHDIPHPFPLHVEVDDNVLLPIQKKALKEYDGRSHPLLS